jgi:elongation factor P--(R)-beta-lysine ligase
MSWWSRDRHADRRAFLLARTRIASAVRAWFAEQGFLEATCGALQITPGAEVHLHAFRTEAVGPDGSAQALYLHTSPEFAAKKLLAAGEDKLFTLAQVFRNRERSRTHAPEFTMLEWYRAHAAYDQAMQDSVALVRLACAAAGAQEICWDGRSLDPSAPAERLTVADAFGRYAGIDLMATLDATGVGDAAALRAGAAAAGVKAPPTESWSDIFARVLAERIEPNLGAGRLTLLCDYPACEAALARRKPGDARLAERFELYACGVELANGFGELTDPVEQRARFEADMAEKEARYSERWPIDEDFLAALAHMPPASGVALGFDRLVMLAAGATHIDQVIWTPAPL